MLTWVARLLPSWVEAANRFRWRCRSPLVRQFFDLAAAQFRNQDGVIQGGTGRGLRFNPGASNAGYLLGNTEPALQQALKRLIRPGMCIYDVGANVGFLSLIAARLTGPRGRVVCFEPLPANAGQVRHNAALNGFAHLEVRQEALGKEDGEAVFLVSAVPTMGRLAAAGPTSREVGAIPVTVRSLDSLLGGGEASVPAPDLVKIDVEGSEVDVLTGARQTLTSIRPLLLIELHGTNDPVAEALDRLDYTARVLGGGDIRQASWNAQVVGVPAERTDLDGEVQSLIASEAKR